MDGKCEPLAVPGARSNAYKNLWRKLTGAPTTTTAYDRPRCQVQMLIESYTPLISSEQAEALALYLQVRGLIR